MLVVQLLGRIFPLIVKAQFTDLFPIDGVSESLGLQMRFIPSVDGNTFLMKCEINKWNKDEHFLHVYMRSLDIARSLIDLGSFQSGIGMTILFETLIEPNGAQSQILSQHPELGVLATSLRDKQQPQTPQDNSFDRIARLVVTSFPIGRALHDLTDSLRETHVSPLVCGRAMEGIRHAIAPGLERKKGWAKMNEALRIDRPYLDLIIDTSTGPRHADPEHIPGPICVEISIRSWTIMNRFFEYLKCGSQPLPEGEFPMLVNHS